MPQSRRASHSSQRFTIGMLTARLNGPTEINLWHGVADRAVEREINLICFSGGIPRSQRAEEAPKNVLYRMAGRPNVDGLLIWTNILSHTLDRPGLLEFCQRYAPLPVISMGVVVPSIPSIRIDMRTGMHKLLAHLIEHHGCKKIAFIRGPEVSPDAQDRYQAYLETTAQYGFRLNPRLIVSGDFQRNSGIIAGKKLIDLGLNEFDAIVSANDNMAIGVLQALQARGIRVPEDVIVVGFDDIEETRAISPSLTTVRAPWYSLGSHSIDLVLKKLADEELPEQILLETEIICRQSCGCRQGQAKENQSDLPEIVISSKQNNKSPNRQKVTNDRNWLQESLRASLSTLAPLQGLESKWSRKLAADFFADVGAGTEESGKFIRSLEQILAPISSGTEILEWLEVLNSIRAEIDRHLETNERILTAHKVVEAGFTFVAELAHRRQLYLRLEAIEQTNRLNHIVQTMATIYDTDLLMKFLATELPGLGIQSCYLSLYDEKGDPPTWSRLILAFRGKESFPVEKSGLRFPTCQLVPEGMLAGDARISFDVEALFFQDEPIGFVLFEIGPQDGDVYTTLRGHLSSALKSAELVQVALEAEAKAIRSDQLKTHLLANVSHELRAPLNIILGLSQTALSSPNSYGLELPAQLSKDLGYIYDSGEHLIRLINDLLDTSRAEIGELDLCIEPVSPLCLLKEVFESFEETSLKKQSQVKMFLEVPDHLPVLHADPVRLRQILMNLLSNALKFTMEGTIILGADVQLPHVHFWVADTGMGISPEMQERIFEPFVTVKSKGQRREGIGLGLSITRRLVALHGGSITLESQPGSGSTFHVYMPLPGLDFASAKAFHAEGSQELLLWLSSQRTPSPALDLICRKNGLSPYWLGSGEDLAKVSEKGKPVALAWDLEYARPGDWAIVQKLRSHAQYCQLPLLIFHENIADKVSGGSRLTNILLKPAGKQMLQHVLSLLPQTLERGEIWIIDDDPEAIKYYQDLISLSLAEFRVRPVRGGMEAIRLLEEATPDLVLLDLMMPDVDGFQVLEQLRSHHKTEATPVIVITGKILSYEDVKRLDVPKVTLQTKGVLSSEESAAEIQRILSSPNGSGQATGMMVKQASAFIQQNYTRSFSLEELAETIGVSKSYLSRIFKMNTGISVWDYLNRYRIQKAKELLLLSNESITTISSSVGYEDAGYFGRVFHELTGVTPRTFRQQGQTTPSNPPGQ